MYRRIWWVSFVVALAALPWAAAAAEPSAGSSEKQDWVLEYYFEVPGYEIGVNSDTAPDNSAPAAYLAIAREWLASRPDTGASGHISYAVLGAPRKGIGRWNELVHTCALQVQIAQALPADLDELDAMLAAPGNGFAPLPAATRWVWRDYDRMKNPERYEPCRLVIDGTPLNYPDEVNGALAERGSVLIYSVRQSAQKAAVFDLPMASREEAHPFGPLSSVERNADGDVVVTTIPISWDFVPSNTPPSANLVSFYDHGEDNAAIKHQVQSFLMERYSGGAQQTLGNYRGTTLVYPLLPEERWATGQPDERYVLDESIAAETQPLFDAYFAVASKWLSEHPAFTDDNKAVDFAAAGGHNWYTLETDPETGKQKGRLVAVLCFEMKLLSDDPAVLAELRTLLDAVPGVHARVERHFDMTDYGLGNYSFAE